ncbi:MAG TPA: magnesium/cobalt transporter CorA [Solirubrobacteraceae bacterium]|nr:magnesium/cobalt transporter CorA [Solirubrobacteraceae bacterium]
MRVIDQIDDPQLDSLIADDEFFWLDVATPSEEEISTLAARFGWHELAVEDLINYPQRPKLDRYGDYMLIVFYGAGRSSDGTPKLIEVHLMVSGSYIVTIRQTECSELDDLRRRFAAKPDAGEQYIVYSVFDTLTDTFFPVLSAIDDEIDELEEAIVAGPSDEQLQRLFGLRRRLVTLRRVVTPQRDLAARTMDEIRELPGLDPDTRDYYRDVYDHLIRISDLIDSYRDLLSGAMDVYLSTVSNRLNVIMKRLTIVATVFLPITALTGFFGQNFGVLVRHIQPLWAFLVYGIGGILMCTVVLLIWFRRSGFLNRGAP